MRRSVVVWPPKGISAKFRISVSRQYCRHIGGRLSEWIPGKTHPRIEERAWSEFGLRLGGEAREAADKDTAAFLRLGV